MFQVCPKIFFIASSRDLAHRSSVSVDHMEGTKERKERERKGEMEGKSLYESEAEEGS